MLDIKLKENISIEGTLLMFDNRTPHVAVPVQAICDGEVIATTLSDENGEYRFINLKPGLYQVRCQILDGYVYYGQKGKGARGQGGKNHVSRFTFYATHNSQCGELLHIEPNKTLSNIDFCFAPFKKGIWRNYTLIDGLTNSFVNAIYSDSDGVMWFGTRSGASRYDGKKFVNFTTRDGLAHNDVYAICGAPDGAIWFGTKGGVSRYDGKEFKTFTTKDGLANNAVRAICSTPDGTLWFGTDGGVTRYHPSAISPQVRIVSVTTDRTYTDLDTIPEITTGTRVSVEYDAIDFVTPEEFIVEKAPFKGRVRCARPVRI